MKELREKMRQRGSAKNSMPKSTIWSLPVSFLCLKMDLKFNKKSLMTHGGAERSASRSRSSLDVRNKKEKYIVSEGGE